MPQARRKKIEGQKRAIREHEAKKTAYTRQHEKDFAQKTIDNATKHLNKLTKKGR